MTRALLLAERGRGRTSPNPMVGAVVVDADGVVVGSGFHDAAGGPHAEIHALRGAGARASGATLYCTLEPCSHSGRTGPCAPRVVQAGIRRAVIAVQDPNPLVAGRGLDHLRANGVDVSVGLLGDAAVRLNAPFFTVMRRARPFVTMKVALSGDGFVAAGPGRRTPLTGPAANRFIHRERAEVDAIGVGSGTILADDPLLTARGAFRHRPLARVIFDRTLRTPPSARVLSTTEAGPVTIVALAPRLPEERLRAEALEAAGAQLELVTPPAPERFLEMALSSLAAREISSLIVEGGPRLHAAFWNAGLVDRVQIFRTAARLGPGGVPWLNDVERWLDGQAGRTTLALEDDLLIEAYVHGAG